MQTNLPIRSISDYILSHNLTTALHGRIDSMAMGGIHSIYMYIVYQCLLCDHTAKFRPQNYSLATCLCGCNTQQDHT